MSCNDCCEFFRGTVKVKEVGVVNGDYHYIITSDNLKLEIELCGVKKAEIALALNLPLWVNTSSKNYSLYSDVLNPELR